LPDSATADLIVPRRGQRWRAGVGIAVTDSSAASCGDAMRRVSSVPVRGRWRGVAPSSRAQRRTIRGRLAASVSVAGAFLARSGVAERAVAKEAAARPAAAATEARLAVPPSPVRRPRPQPSPVHPSALRSPVRPLARQAASRAHRGLGRAGPGITATPVRAGATKAEAAATPMHGAGPRTGETVAERSGASSKPEAPPAARRATTPPRASPMSPLRRLFGRGFGGAVRHSPGFVSDVYERRPAPRRQPCLAPRVLFEEATAELEPRSTKRPRPDPVMGAPSPRRQRQSGGK